jgi:hypothetical protein
MKKTILVALAALVSLTTMSFKPETEKIDPTLVSKVEKSNLKTENQANVGSATYSCTPLLVYAAVSLAESSYAATMVATAAAVNYVVGTNTLQSTPKEIEESINDVSLHSLDKN